MTYNSNAIEGNTLTLRETYLILEEGITIRGKPLKDHVEAKETEGVYCKFTDGSFEGFLSWASLKKLIAWKSNPKPGQKK